jgi:hypothetical protein
MTESDEWLDPITDACACLGGCGPQDSGTKDDDQSNAGSRYDL